MGVVSFFIRGGPLDHIGPRPDGEGPEVSSEIP